MNRTRKSKPNGPKPARRARNYRRRADLLAGLPAVVVLLVGGLMTIRIVAGSRGSTARWYREQAVAALARGEHSRAKICFERVLEADPQDIASQQGLSLCSPNAGGS